MRPSLLLSVPVATGTPGPKGLIPNWPVMSLGSHGMPCPDEDVSMSAEIVVGVASAAVSVVGAVAAGLMTTWSAQRMRRYEALVEAQQKAKSKAEQAEAVLSRYREPLL